MFIITTKLLKAVGCLYHKMTEEITNSGIKDWKKEYADNCEKCRMFTYEETMWAGKGTYTDPEK